MEKSGSHLQTIFTSETRKEHDVPFHVSFLSSEKYLSDCLNCIVSIGSCFRTRSHT